MIALDRRVLVLVDEPHGDARFPWQHNEYRYNGQTG